MNDCACADQKSVSVNAAGIGKLMVATYPALDSAEAGESFLQLLRGHISREVAHKHGRAGRILCMVPAPSNLKKMSAL